MIESIQLAQNPALRSKYALTKSHFNKSDRAQNKLEGLVIYLCHVCGEKNRLVNVSRKAPTVGWHWLATHSSCRYCYVRDAQFPCSALRSLTSAKQQPSARGRALWIEVVDRPERSKASKAKRLPKGAIRNSSSIKRILIETHSKAVEELI